MKFLQKLIYVSALFALMAATPYDSLRSNRVAAPVQVSCGGRIWTDGEELGKFMDTKVYTYIHENRIYIKREGIPGAGDNYSILYHLDNNRFPIDGPSSAFNMIEGCVNNADPSTAATGYLQPRIGDAIPCNNKLITDNLYLGAYIGDDHVKTFQYVKIVDDRLRINFHREGTTRDPDALSMGLIKSTFAGDNQSFINPDLPFSLSLDEVNGCFWNAVPKTATLVNPTQACPAGPALQSISNVTKTSLRFTFTGTDVPNVKWRIKINNAEVRSGTTDQLSNNTTVDLTFASLDAGTYNLEIEGGDCTSSITSMPFNVTTPACAGGPTISTITNINSTSLTVNFAGSGVPNLIWAIKNGGTILASGTTENLTSNTAILTFGNIVNGTYSLEIQGGDCSSSVSTQSFVISANCARGPVVQDIASITSQSLNFLFDGDGVYAINWKIMQGNNMISQGIVSPTSNRPVINYSSLADGQYQLQIQGGSCISAVSSMAFALGVSPPLPIEVTNFEATPVSKGIDLSWKVLSEKNGDGFEIIRFNDNKLNASQTIGKVALSEQRIGNYHFTDENPETGINYYQLKQIDSDGTFTKSRIISAKFEQLSEAFISPNPAVDFVNVQFTSRISGTSGIELYNMAGIKLSTSNINIKEGQNSYRINLGKLGQGYYFVKVLQGEQNAHLRFVKVN